MSLHSNPQTTPQTVDQEVRVVATDVKSVLTGAVPVTTVENWLLYGAAIAGSFVPGIASDLRYTIVGVCGLILAAKKHKPNTK